MKHFALCHHIKWSFSPLLFERNNLCGVPSLEVSQGQLGQDSLPVGCDKRSFQVPFSSNHSVIPKDLLTVILVTVDVNN